MIKEQEARASSTAAPHDPLLFRLAVAISRITPRGKAAIPRMIGRLMGDRAFATDAPRGFKIAGNRYSIDMLAFLKIAGQWDDKVIEALLRHIDERAVVYDIGANAGYYSLCFAAGRPQARLFAFEPIPMLAKGLATSAKLNDFGHLRVFQAVLSDRTGETTFYLPRHAIHASLVSREADAEAVTVPSFRLDDVIASGDLPPPDAIKMDVEGAEMMVLAGAADTLTRHKPVICYEADENSERFGHRPGDVIRKLQQFGYTRFCKIEGGGERLIAEPEVDAVTPGDFLAFG